MRLARRGRGHGRIHLGNEGEPDIADSPDGGLFAAIIADRLTRRLDTAGNRGVGNDATAPYASDDVVLGDDPCTVLDEEFEQREDLRLHSDRNAVRP